MTVYTSRFSFQWNYAAHDSGWGDDFNYTMRALAALLDCYLVSDTVATPPVSPAEDDAYYVPSVATGAWSTNTGKIAAYQGGGWQYYTLPAGLRAYIVSRSGFYWFNGSTWVAELTSGGGGGVLTVAGHLPDISGDVALVVADITGAAPLSSPALTGAPTVPNSTALSRSTKIANTKYVDDAVTAANAATATVPLAFVMPGLPAAGQIYNVPIAVAVQIPANFAGAVIYGDVLPTSSAVFTVKKISSGTTTTIGTITKTTSTKTSKTLSTQAAVSFAVGDVLQLVAPSSQDATLAEVGVTLSLTKV